MVESIYWAVALFYIMHMRGHEMVEITRRTKKKRALWSALVCGDQLESQFITCEYDV